MRRVHDVDLGKNLIFRRVADNRHGWQPSCSVVLADRARFAHDLVMGVLGKCQVAQMRILLVEDHPESRRALQRLIERRGHEVVGVGSAEEAEVELKKQAFPFLILDWMLPGKSGVELCRELRSGPNGEEL